MARSRRARRMGRRLRSASGAVQQPGLLRLNRGAVSHATSVFAIGQRVEAFRRSRRAGRPVLRHSSRSGTATRTAVRVHRLMAVSGLGRRAAASAPARSPPRHRVIRLRP